ncbi:MAG: hypothetical protein KatS3mg048_3644 [Caldilinea sp.]|nr:MAG: hypothetical protein KatS3mg048_3644 [Caldilinea sp.]
MTQLGIQIIPTMPVDEVIATAVMAEELSYDFCLLADEGFMPDVYVALGAIAQRTQRIRLGPVTNGYTRHPAATATAIATLDDLSGGRALATLVAGGSMVLNPMGIAREAPLTVMRETVAILRALWSGEEVTWQGKRYALQRARLHSQRRHAIPLWLAVRGEKMLELAGQEADGVVLVAKSDVGPALAIVEQAAACPWQAGIRWSARSAGVKRRATSRRRLRRRGPPTGGSGLWDRRRPGPPGRRRPSPRSGPPGGDAGPPAMSA